MIRSRSRKASVRIENLEARIALSGAGAPPEVEPIAASDVEVTTLPALDELDTPVSVTFDSVEPFHPDVLVDPAILMSATSSPIEPGVAVDGEPLMLHDVPLMAQSGMVIDGAGAPDGAASEGQFEILPISAPLVDPAVLIATDTPGEGRPLPDFADVPLMAQSGLQPQPNSQGVRTLRLAPSLATAQLPVDLDTPLEAQVQILSGSGTTNDTRLARARLLSGVVRGEVQLDSNEIPIDGGAHYRLNGEGRFGSMGQVVLTGNLLRDGFVPVGSNDLSGVVNLKDSRGAISVRLEGSSQGLTSGRPVRLNASILSGSGPYQSLRGLGPAMLRLGANGFSLGMNLAPPRR